MQNKTNKSFEANEAQKGSRVELKCVPICVKTEEEILLLIQIFVRLCVFHR